MESLCESPGIDRVLDATVTLAETPKTGRACPDPSIINPIAGGWIPPLCAQARLHANHMTNFMVAPK